MLNQSVLKMLQNAAKAHATAWAKIREAAAQAAVDRMADESVKDAHTRIYKEYLVGLAGPEFAQVRQQFSVALLLALQPGGKVVEIKSPAGKEPAVFEPVTQVTAWNVAKNVAASLREDCGMASSGRKGTGKKTSHNPVPPGPVFPGVSTAPAMDLNERWDAFGKDLLDAMSDPDMRKKVIGILYRSGYQCVPIAAKREAKIPTMKVPKAKPSPVDVQDRLVQA
jgi:hypothetical protein